MVFFVLAIVLSAACFQSSLAAVAVETASTTTSSSASVTGPGVSSLGIMNPASAINNANLISQMYNSPFIPTSSIYGADLLCHFPNFMFCDCDLSPLIDATVFGELSLLTTKYNQRSCDLQQWERLINMNMPGIDSINELNMLTSLAAAIQREQVRRNLVFGGYSDFCVNYIAAVDGIPSPADVVLARREPQVATTTSSATTTTVTNTPAPWDNTPYYYTMQYLMDQTLPKLSPDLRLDIINSVMANTPPQFYNMAHTLSQQLTSNIRGMVSDMVDLTETFL